LSSLTNKETFIYYLLTVEVKMNKGILLIVLLSALMVSVSGCYGGVQKSPSEVEAFLVVNDVAKAREALDGERHVFPDKGVIIGTFSRQDLMKKSSVIEKVYYEYSNDVPSEFTSEFTSWKSMLDYKKMPLSEKLANIPDVEPIYNDMIEIEKPSLGDLNIVPRGIPLGAEATDTSSYMIGDVTVSVIFPESNELVCQDPPACNDWGPGQEDWTDEEIQEVKDEITLSMDWWADRDENASLTFLYIYEERIPTDYEPIWGPGTGSEFGRCLWINDVMADLGYSSGDCISNVYDYVNDHRDTTDWGFVSFVVDSSFDEDGMFDYDGSYAFAVSSNSGGGPYSVMTYDNAGHGIENMDAVSAHETGHIFGALDEYSCECYWQSGYLDYPNENCANIDCELDENSIMRGGISPFTNGLVDYYARGQIGWQDEDEDGILDIVDTIPGAFLNPFYDNSEGNFYFDGDSWVNIFNAVNPDYNDISINVISNVEYRFRTNGEVWSSWFGAIASDGMFDNATELFEFIVGDLPTGDHDIQAKATNRFGNWNESNIQTIIATGIPPMCYETDDGYDIYHFGIVIDDYGTYEDECYGRTLLEWFCDGPNGVNAEEVYCSRGCSAGKCNVGGGSCFIEGTQITMADGTEKDIEEIKVGDKILAYNFERGSTASDVVVSLNRPVHDDMILVKFGDSENTNTFDHPYYVEEKGWSSYAPELTMERYGKFAEELRDVKQLEKGDVIFTVNGEGDLVESKIENIDEEMGLVQTYIFTVENNGNFSANGALVHNKQYEIATTQINEFPYEDK